tara:strand:+ start:508 stop:1014 length:507 start_codon:yes stop_codon:yes gene_type:complete
MALKLDHDDLNRLIEKISASDIQEFSLEGEDFKLEIKRNLPYSPPAGPVFNNSPLEVISKQVQEEKNENITSAVTPSSSPSVPPPARSDLLEITSPMVGTFYRASAPGEDPFVEVGTSIVMGQTICILEAMKLMNEIESEHNGEIVEILVENGTPVEFGQVLMRVKQV